ncbi:hypothetical protein LEP1GSC171_1558 [Leptospira santarosai str. HAI1380]|nr:hypothetical protein LEP1GSC171_1558 [Leptospira santarosai str. HAI1380]KXZ28149.1 hypothetical protein AYB33_06030 [Leptospira santarosai]
MKISFYRSSLKVNPKKFRLEDRNHFQTSLYKSQHTKRNIKVTSKIFKNDRIAILLISTNRVTSILSPISVLKQNFGHPVI